MQTNDSSENYGGMRVDIMRKIIWLARKHRQYLMTLEDSFDLGGGQVPVLMELNHHGELSQRELADRVRVTAATMSGLLKRMEKRGLIARKADAGDARVSLVHLTERGAASCKEAHGNFDLACERMLESVTEDECRQLLALLEKLQGNAQAMDAACGVTPEEEGEKA